MGLVGGQLGLEGPLWSAVGALNDNFGTLGYLIIAIFVLSWLVSIAIYRIRGYDAIEVSGQG